MLKKAHFCSKYHSTFLYLYLSDIFASSLYILLYFGITDWDKRCCFSGSSWRINILNGLEQVVSLPIFCSSQSWSPSISSRSSNGYVQFSLKILSFCKPNSTLPLLSVLYRNFSFAVLVSGLLTQGFISSDDVPSRECLVSLILFLFFLLQTNFCQKYTVKYTALVNLPDPRNLWSLWIQVSPTLCTPASWVQWYLEGHLGSAREIIKNTKVATGKLEEFTPVAYKHMVIELTVYRIFMVVYTIVRDLKLFNLNFIFNLISIKKQQTQSKCYFLFILPLR